MAYVASQALPSYFSATFIPEPYLSTQKGCIYTGRVPVATLPAITNDAVDSNSLDSLRSESLHSYDEPQTVTRVLSDGAGLSQLGEDEAPLEKQGNSKSFWTVTSLSSPISWSIGLSHE